MLEKLATSLGRKDDEPNITLATELATAKDHIGIAAIVKALQDDNSAIVGDCIKVLYEIGARDPYLIAGHHDIFITLLRSKNNRLVWGAMTALAYIAPLKPKELSESFNLLHQAYTTGSVITIDRSISLFAELVKAGVPNADQIFTILIEHLETCRPKEVGQHAEKVFICITKNNVDSFRNAVRKRYTTLAASQKKRIDTLLNKILYGKFTT